MKGTSLPWPQRAGGVDDTGRKNVRDSGQKGRYAKRASTISKLVGIPIRGENADTLGEARIWGCAKRDTGKIKSGRQRGLSFIRR